MSHFKRDSTTSWQGPMAICNCLSASPCPFVQRGLLDTTVGMPWAHKSAGSLCWGRDWISNYRPDCGSFDRLSFGTDQFFSILAFGTGVNRSDSRPPGDYLVWYFFINYPYDAQKIRRAEQYTRKRCINECQVFFAVADEFAWRSAPNNGFEKGQT